MKQCNEKAIKRKFKMMCLEYVSYCNAKGLDINDRKNLEQFKKNVLSKKGK